jgi:hypothetical protein
MRDLIFSQSVSLVEANNPLGYFGHDFEGPDSAGPKTYSASFIYEIYSRGLDG